MEIIDNIADPTPAEVVVDPKEKARNTRSRAFIFTWNNFKETPEAVTWLENWSKRNCDEYRYQEEIGKEGTVHLQGYWYFKNARSCAQVKKEIYPAIHFEVAQNKFAAQNYCKKLETKVEGGIEGEKSKIKLIDPLEGKELRPFQKTIMDIVDNEPDPRKIYWVVDHEGNSGKTSLAKHLCIKKTGECLYVSGKAADIKCGVAFHLEKHGDLRIAIFDFPRTSEGKISYDGIESIKNGIFFSTKYESGMVIFNTPHVICFANWMPDMNALSKDRWVIIRASEAQNDLQIVAPLLLPI